MKNFSYAIIGFMVISIWTVNIFLLNSISRKEKEYNDKRKISQELQKEHENIILQYDASVDLEKIREEMIKKGFKQARDRDIIYFRLEKRDSEKQGE